MPKPPQHPRKRACAECDDLRGRLARMRSALLKYKAEAAAALANCEEQRRLAAKAETVLGYMEPTYLFTRDELERVTIERDKWIAEWEALNKERAKIEDERDRYRILRDAASEASLRLRISNLKLEADCAAIRKQRDMAEWKLRVSDDLYSMGAEPRRAEESSLLRVSVECPVATATARTADGQRSVSAEMPTAPKPLRGFWSWVMRQKPFGRGKG